MNDNDKPLLDKVRSGLDGNGDPEPTLQYFNFSPEMIETATDYAITKAFADVACTVLVYGKRGPERSVAIRKLLEGLDAARRAAGVW